MSPQDMLHSAFATAYFPLTRTPSRGERIPRTRILRFGPLNHPRSRPSANLSPTGGYLFSLVATHAGGARRLRRFRVAQSHDVRCCLSFRKARPLRIEN